ncbi:MAG: Glutamate--tRNA ligase [Flavobacterium sp. SCGC AAA160-P02]|nr:MAG: Glutamate--tRNA ligase [Flavobacterium sp. SCGC AAA160-P02]
MKSSVRVRFAPSPTGPLHIGGVRTALYNYLFAKKHNGTFVLRIEDTDRNRLVKNAERYIIDAIKWCNIPYDEGPYRQSERSHIYKKYVDILIKTGKAYYAFDTPEALEKERKGHEKKGKTFIYNYHNREKGRLVNSLVLSKKEVQEKICAGEKFVVRFKCPEIETLKMVDEIRGKIIIDTRTLDDKVLFKSDGMPTYHLANIVDDHLMKISHVIRGEEWLPSMALHVLLYKAFNWAPPKFAHLPLILKPTGKGKLSKRDGDKHGFPVFPLEYTNEQTGETSRGFKEVGYFSDAFINMLAFLGWNPGTDQEIFSLNKLIDAFDLSKVGKSGSRFNLDKARWFNQQYLQQKPVSELARLYRAELNDKKINLDRLNDLEKIVSLIKERAVFVSDFWRLSSFFFVTPCTFEQKTLDKHRGPESVELLLELLNTLSIIKDFSSIAIENSVKEWITNKGIGFGKTMQLLRLALVGEMKGPSLFDVMEIIGEKETILRINNLIKNYEN